MAASAPSTPLTLLPDGIPTYRGKHARFDWPSTLGPTLLLHDDFDVLWIRGGCASMEFAGGGRLRAETGDLIFLPPFTPATIDQSAGKLKFWHCHFDFRAGASPKAPSIHVPLIFKARRGRVIAAAYRALNGIDPASDRAAWKREAALIHLIEAIAAAAPPRHSGAPSAEAVMLTTLDPRIALLRRKLDAHPETAWRVAALAREIDLSPNHLHALWRKPMGCSLKSYLVRNRLKLAMKKLRDEGSAVRPSVKMVAASCGFSSQHLFTRQFHQTFGVTPTAFQKSAGL